jgi:hypothetical protein
MRSSPVIRAAAIDGPIRLFDQAFKQLLRIGGGLVAAVFSEMGFKGMKIGIVKKDLARFLNGFRSGASDRSSGLDADWNRGHDPDHDVWRRL